MSSFRIRPRFKQVYSLSPDEAQQLLEDRLKTDECPCVKGNSAKGYLVVRIPEEEIHAWSPQLSLTIEEHEQGCEIRGHYGPRPSLWALFTYGYAALGILALFAGIWGVSQMMLKKPAPVLWSLPVFAGLAVGLYLTAQTGQKLGAEQTFTLHHFFEETMGKRVHIH